MNTSTSQPDNTPASQVTVIVCAHNEADRLEMTLSALKRVFPGSHLVVADDASTDATARIGKDEGAKVISAPRNLGKGGAATLAARHVLQSSHTTDSQVVVLCDGDLGSSATHLLSLA